MAVPLKELGSKLSYQEVNDMLKLFPGASTEEPATPYDGQIWLDTTTSRLMRYNGSEWIPVGGIYPELQSDYSVQDISSTDLDVLDKTGFFVGENLTNAPESNTNWHWVVHLRFGANSAVQLACLSNKDTPKLFKRAKTNFTWGAWLKVWTEDNDGSGSGLDADTVDGLESTQLVRTDADSDVSAHTEWQDGYQARFGSNADLRIQYNGDYSSISNYNGGLYIRQQSHGDNLYLQAEDASGVNKTLITLDPDADRVTTKLDRQSLPDLWNDNALGETSNLFIQTGHNYVTVAGNNITFAEAFSETPRVFVQPEHKDRGFARAGSRSTTSFGGSMSDTGDDIDWLAIGKKL